MRAAGQTLWAILDQVLSRCVAGESSQRLGAVARAAIIENGAEPIMEGYAPHGASPFPGAACICINEEAIHAPPSPRILRPGDMVTIDIAIRHGGWCADAARSVIVPGEPAAAPPGSSPTAVARLLNTARRAADEAALAMLPGVRWSTVAAVAQGIAAAEGLTLIPGYNGHGIGRALHEPPRAWSAQHDLPIAQAPDFVLRPGMVLTIEPILTLGRPDTILLDDGWTLLTADRSPVCHEERTVAVTRRGPLILTAP